MNKRYATLSEFLSLISTTKYEHIARIPNYWVGKITVVAGDILYQVSSAEIVINNREGTLKYTITKNSVGSGITLGYVKNSDKSVDLIIKAPSGTYFILQAAFDTYYSVYNAILVGGEYTGSTSSMVELS